MRFAPALRHRRVSALEPARFIGACTATGVPQVSALPIGINLGPVYGSGTITYAYQWKLDGVNGVTTQTYAPAVGDVGKVATCVVTPSGGGGSAAGVTVAVGTVLAAAGGGAGSVSLPNWKTPTLDGDGTTLTDFSVSRVLYGISPGVYTASQDVAGTGTITTTITGLSVGTTYYIVVQSVDTSGNVSSSTPEITLVAA